MTSAERPDRESSDMPRLYREAARIAYTAMGTDQDRFGVTHRAIEDPLACWCLTQWIVDFAIRSAGVVRGQSLRESGRSKNRNASGNRGTQPAGHLRDSGERPA
jgi:hypothetical protein